MSIILGTRGSALALAQSRIIARRIERLGTGTKVEIRIVKTLGDRLERGALTASRGRGKAFFVKELEDALLDRSIDLAVHSLKDLPPDLPRGLVLACVPRRESPADAYVSRRGRRIEDERADARIGTASPRRVAQLSKAFPGFRFHPLRGNVDTRLRKMRELKFDGIILACAGLRRLGRAGEKTHALDYGTMLPAAGQGALGLECRAADRGLRALLARLEDADARWSVEAERLVLAALGGGCSAPIGVLARPRGRKLVIEACAVSLDGTTSVRGNVEAGPRDWRRACRSLAHRLLKAGAKRILEEARAAAG